MASRHVAERVRAHLPLRASAPPSGEPTRFPAWMTLPAAVITLVAVLALAVAIWLQVLHKLRHPKPIPFATPPSVTGVVWGHRVYLDVRSLRSALSARGVRYETWARKHRAAETILRARTRHP